MVGGGVPFFAGDGIAKDDFFGVALDRSKFAGGMAAFWDIPLL